jgi:hypothetical protein
VAVITSQKKVTIAMTREDEENTTQKTSNVQLTLKMATATFVETLNHFQHSTRLIHES